MKCRALWRTSAQYVATVIDATEKEFHQFTGR